jgi:hypothetical protein
MGDFFSVAGEQHVAKALGLMNIPSLADAPPEVRRRLIKEARKIANDSVFGVGNTTEVGLGAVGNETKQSVEAYIKANHPPYRMQPEPNYEEHLAKKRKDLAECEARRRAERAAAEDEMT